MMTWARVSLLALFTALAATGAAANEADNNYQTARACSTEMKKGAQLAPEAHRACVLAIATTYVDAEDNSLAPEKQLVADDVSRHRLGTPPEHKAGNGAKLIADMSHAVIAAIKNRRWVVEGNNAWVEYDGYLTSDPEKPGFYVAERITIENGLIKEILVAGVSRK